jgi:cellulose synthase/poly-beta-1,6-N-acetylglucosamine synthase-like glycosyltransferase
MRFASLERHEADDRVRASVSGLAERHPELSAASVLTVGQRNLFLLLLLVFLIVSIILVVPAYTCLVAAFTLVYTAGITNRLYLAWRSRRRDHVDVVTPREARLIPDDELPIYTVLVPAFREPAVIRSLLANIGKLDYPRDRLDVKVVLEADDQETIEAIRQVDVGDFVEVVIVPAAEPRTKPKALNYGLSLARGSMITVYDAEDQPDPLQLRKAVAALQRHEDDVACMQAMLSYDNVSQNLITKWFTLEYLMWFRSFLPGLVAVGGALPLGGTSNHFRRAALEEVGAWDPYNVTEDADLGIRLHRLGYRVRVLASVTLEEANSDFVNWVKQRSRWYKGYLQTFLLHLRQPRLFARQVGRKGFSQFSLFVGGTPLIALVNPVFWLMMIVWFVGKPHLIRAIYPAPVFYPSLLCWALGNFAMVYLTVMIARQSRRYELVGAALLVPLYWIMMSIAAVKAVTQLVSKPSFWEKTMHGLRSSGEREDGRWTDALPVPAPVLSHGREPVGASRASSTTASQTS